MFSKVLRILISIILIINLVHGVNQTHVRAASVSADSVSNEEGNVVLVVIDQITLDDLLKADVPELKKLAGQGSIGLMTTNAAGGSSRDPVHTYLTVGSGSKVRGSQLGAGGYNAWEEYERGYARDAHFRNTGRRVADSQVVHLGVIEMQKNNESLKYKFVLGAIGTILHQNGFKTAVIGNADLPGRRTPEERNRRQIVSIAMDNNGIVDYGDVSARTYLYNPESLSGASTDFDYILGQYDNFQKDADLIVIETGDMSRNQSMAQVTDEKVLLFHKMKTLTRIDGFVGQLMKRLDLQKDLLMVVVPGPPSEAVQKGNLLTPFIIAGKGVTPGLVWSGTIKRTGFISNTDIAATIVSYFDAEKVVSSESSTVKLGGQSIESRYSANPFSELSEINEKTVFNYITRIPVVRGYTNIVLGILAAGIIGAFFRWPVNRYVRLLLLSLTWVPGILLFHRYLPGSSLWTYVPLVAIIALFLAKASSYVSRNFKVNKYLLPTGITALALVIDLFCDSLLQKTSPFSYDVMAGARFYGIGNEYMGVLIGCVIIFTGLLFDSLKVTTAKRKIAASFVFLIVTYAVAAPNLGTNVGGSIAAVAGFGVSGLILFGGKINQKAVLAVSVSIMVVLLAFITYDMTRSVETQSHIGRTFTLIRENGFEEISNIIGRKWEVNMKLIRNSTWSWVYFVSLFALPLLSRFLPGAYDQLKTNNPWFIKLLTGMVFGSIFALIFNDSGVIAAATMIIFGISPFLDGMLDETNNDR